MLAESVLLREAIVAVEGEAGAAGVGVPAVAALEDGGRRIVLRPEAPLRGWTSHALVLSSLVRAADGRPVLDPGGRRRTFVVSFETAAPPGPPPEPAITEVRADAETPEAGGEYVEVANLAPARSTSPAGGWGNGPRPARSRGAPSRRVRTRPSRRAASRWWRVESYDGRYPLPAGTAVLACGATALLGGLATTGPRQSCCADPRGEVVATLGEGGAPLCPVVERRDAAGPDEPGNLV